MYESSGLHFFRTTTGVQSGPNAFNESRFIMTFVTIFGVIEMCSLRLVPEGKTGKEIPKSSRLEFLHSSQRVFIPPFQIIPPSLIPPFKKSLIPSFPILFFQTLNIVMLIASAKSQSAREASHQPAVMFSCLTISHTCLPCLPNGRVSHCVPGFTEVESF